VLQTPTLHKGRSHSIGDKEVRKSISSKMTFEPDISHQHTRELSRRFGSRRTDRRAWSRHDRRRVADQGQTVRCCASR
jgi:hypothetical protein